MMPGIARKLLICAAPDGLIIQPLSAKGQRPFHPLRIGYGDAIISTASREQVPDTTSPDSSFEAFGIIGLFTVSRLSYLVTITKRQQVAQVYGSPIYVVTEVALTPCSSRGDAEEAVKNTSVSLRTDVPQSASSDGGEETDEDVEVPAAIADDIDDAIADDDSGPNSTRSSVAEDVIRRRGSYGRFAQRWFSGSGWTLEQKRSMGMSNSPTLPPVSAKAVPVPDIEPITQTQVSNLLPKLLRTAQILFGASRSFYFSYDFDITHSLEHRTRSTNTDTPLYTQVDRFFFWNRHVMQPFINAGQESLILPVMQGFVGEREFAVDRNPPQIDELARDSVELCNLSPAEAQKNREWLAKLKTKSSRRSSEESYTVILISRRSTKRCGLRYLRRGIDQDGFTANTVETEQLLCPTQWSPSGRAYSFVQIRGSIPLFFTQSPYSFKPVPVLQHSDEVNRRACQKHFEKLLRNYGAIQIVNLVEKHGIEEPIGTRYERTVSYLNNLAQGDRDDESGSLETWPAGKTLDFEWFDFHAACRGMRFENVSILLSSMKNRLESFGSTKAEGGKIVRKQLGVLRTNCMDCLDRTNVCQSSFAKHILEVQLKEEGFDMSAQIDQETSWFNTLWADNGDAVSKQYASTAAMKGDYTRTRKRDYRGALNDLGLSLARFYSGMVNDYFSQTAIDFLLGNVTDGVFDEFEADMMTKDPAVSMNKMREQAINLCQKRVVADETEEYHGGWVLLSPNASDRIKSDPMEEVVLLLTDAALYLCRFDWNLDKVSSFERVHLASITGIKRGTYITSTISTSQTDESKNVGFVVSYQPGKTDIKRTNTRTLSSKGDLVPGPRTEDKGSTKPLSLVTLFSGGSKAPPPARIIAFKAPYTESSVVASGSGPNQTELQQVSSICAEIERLTLQHHLHKSNEDKKGVVEDGDIISLEEAKRNTGLLEHLGHSIKKLVWA
uniref:SAC domain-containing protein n=1 Tax=Bionectria ochroleuca TaxID=29856 RepID=A0A0B7KEE8_BIOOC